MTNSQQKSLESLAPPPTPAAQLRAIAADLREARNHMNTWIESPTVLRLAIDQTNQILIGGLNDPWWTKTRPRLQSNIYAATTLLVHAPDAARGYVAGVIAEMELLASSLERNP